MKARMRGSLAAAVPERPFQPPASRSRKRSSIFVIARRRCNRLMTDLAEIGEAAPLAIELLAQLGVDGVLDVMRTLRSRYELRAAMAAKAHAAQTAPGQRTIERG